MRWTVHRDQAERDLNDELEAFAEHLHRKVRREFWGYAPDEALAPDAERQFAARMKATTVEIPSSHVAMVSWPDDVTELIESAAKAVPVAAGA